MDVIKEQFENLVSELTSQLGSELAETKEVLAEYAAERSQVLATILENEEPGFDLALTAARDNVALKAGLKFGEDAEMTDHVMLGAFAGALRFAAIALAAI